MADNTEWMDYRDAAKLMHRPAPYLRRRNADGTYKHFPEIERWQPGGYGTKVFVRREHVEAWIEASRTPAPSPVKRDTLGITYAGALPTMRRLGADKVIRAFGLK